MKGSSSVSTHAEQLSGRKRATGIPARTVTPCPVRARRFGGRWNPPLLFPAIYLADSAQACMVEVERAAQAASTTAEKMLEAAYRLHTIDVTDLAVLDLTTRKLGKPWGSRTTTSMATTGQGARRSDMRPGSCTCKVSSCRRRAVSASLSPRMNSELGRANYNCDKASI